MAVAVAQNALKSKSIHHREWHEGDKLRMKHHYERKRVAWGASAEERMTPSVSSASVTYSINPNMHYLENLFSRYKTPHLRVKSDLQGFVRIALCPRLLHNLVVKAEMKISSDTITMDNRIMDLSSEWFMKPGFYDAYMESIGERDELTLWGTEIPSVTLECPQPWYFSQDKRLSVPIWMDPKVSFTYTYRDDLKYIVRMCVIPDLYDAFRERKQIDPEEVKDLDEADWVEVPFNIECLTERDSKISIFPDMYAIYGYRTEEELDWWRKCGKTRSYNVTEYLPCKSDNKVQSGSNAVVNAITYLPIRRIAYVAENLQASANRQYSNYTDSLGPNGKSPCQTYSLSIGDIDLVSDEPCSRSGFLTAWYNFDSTPNVRGYHMHSIVDSGVNKMDNDVSLTASDGRVKLTVNIDSDNSPKTEYMLYGYIQVVRVLEYIPNKSGGWDVKLETKSNKKLEEGKSNSDS